jgi:hypothetical protein
MVTKKLKPEQGYEFNGQETLTVGKLRALLTEFPDSAVVRLEHLNAMEMNVFDPVGLFAANIVETSEDRKFKATKRGEVNTAIIHFWGEGGITIE